MGRVAPVNDCRKSEAVRKRGLAPVCCGLCSMQIRDKGCLSPFPDSLSGLPAHRLGNATYRQHVLIHLRNQFRGASEPDNVA